MDLLLALVAPAWWLLKQLGLYFALVVTLTTLWRTSKTLWGRRNKLPVSGNDAVLITGATAGIGLSLAKHLYKLGYSVIACYYDAQEAGFSELQTLAKSGSSKRNQHMILLELDVRREQSIADAYDECLGLLAKHKLKLYAVVNNAGLGSLQPFSWLDRNRLSAIVQTNTLGVLLVARQFIAKLIESKGRLINVSSGLAFVPGPTYATYGLTKAALVYFNSCLNMELKSRYGLKSIVIAPQNLIKNTNIVNQNVALNETAWASMSELEREIFKNEFEEQRNMVKQLEEARKEQAKAAQRPQQQQQQQGNKPATGSARSGSQAAAGLWPKLAEFWRSARGTKQVISLEESGILECFEDALRLENPNEIMFAGDSIFNFVFGSVLLSIPTSCSHLLGASISQSLYK